MGRELVPGLNQENYLSMEQANYGIVAGDQGLDLSTYLDVLRRRYLLLVIPALIGFAATAVVVLFVLPPVYEATAKILVQSQLIPTDLAASTVTASASERVKIIEQRLTTRSNLLEIARKFDLYPDERGRASPSEIVEWIRDATHLEQMQQDLVARPAADVLGFTLSFEYSDPGTAARVTNELVSSILQQNIESREARAGETSKFFSQQVSKLESDLSAMETRIADFKKANEGSLPETLPDRRRQLSELRMIIQQLSSGADPQGVVETKEEVNSLNARLKAAQQQLANTIEQRSGLEKLYKKGYTTKTRMLEVDNQIAELQAQIETVKSSLNVAQTKLDAVGGDPASIQERRGELVKQADALNESILRTPDVEATLSSLNRDYKNLQAEYNNAKSKTIVATTGQQMEEDRQAERFEVLEQASVPDEPTSPNRPLLLGAGAVGSIGLGLGLVILMELLDKSIRTSVDLERRLQIRPLMTIPYVTTAIERKGKRHYRDLFLRVGVAAIVVGAVLVHQLYLPLDVLINKLMLKVGGIG